MPQVGKQSFPYTPQGVQAAKAAAPAPGGNQNFRRKAMAPAGRQEGRPTQPQMKNPRAQMLKQRVQKLGR
jgi:hypothetical protein